MSTAFHRRKDRIITAAVFLLLIFMLSGCAAIRRGNEGIHLGMEAIEKNEYEEALDQFKAAEERGEDQQLICRGRGIAYMGLSEYKKAAKELKSALTYSRGRVTDLEYDISFYLAVAQFRSGDPAGAKETCSAILDLDRKNSDALFLRGKTELMMEEKDFALRDFNAAVRFRRDDPDLYINIYECMADAGFADEGSGFLKSAMELTRITEFQKGKLYYWMEDYDNAKGRLEQARGDGSDPNVIQYLGRTYEALGDKSYAASLYKTYLADNPDNVTICNSLGLCLLDTGDYEGALAAFRQGLEGSSGDMTQALKFNEIVACEYLADFKKAAVLMEAYLKEYPDDEAAKREYIFLSTR